jgi:uncharacterized protein YktA (UPF0223 family)
VQVKVTKLKESKEKLETLSLDFAKKVFDKLQKYKEKLVLSVTQAKMIEEIKKEVDDLDQQIKDFFKPLFNSYQNKNNYSFTDPDPFCIKVSETVLKNVTFLDNKMDELLACESGPNEEVMETAEVIQQLVEYYENVAITVKEFAEKYNKFKRRMAFKASPANHEELLRKITEKANTTVSKDMESY